MNYMFNCRFSHVVNSGIVAKKLERTGKMTKLVNDNVIIGGSRIAYGVHGEGEPLLLIHGTPFFSHIWRKVLPSLVDAGHNVYIYDLLGFGHSERPRDPSVDTSVSGQLPVLLELMTHWGIESCHVVAHDIGGAIAQQLGIFHPERIKTLTIIDTVSFDSWPSKRTREQMAAGLESLIGASDAEHRRHFSEWIYSAAFDHENLAAGPHDAYLDMISGPVGQASLFQHQIMHYDPGHTLKVVDRLHELENLPVQFIWGANDQWQVVDWAHKLHAAVPGSTLHILENCGHLVPEDQPEKLSELVKAHTSTCKRPQLAQV